METLIVPVNSELAHCSISYIENRIKLRTMPDEDWIETYGSGTLRKNKRIGFSWKSQCRHERVCYEYGYPWEILPRTYVTFGDAITEGDCHAITEAGWFIERYKSLSIFSEDYIEAKYINADYKNGSEQREGVGIILRETSSQWLPVGHLVFCIVAEFDKKNKRWHDNAVNPF